jgi:hypothetical protein
VNVRNPNPPKEAEKKGENHEGTTMEKREQEKQQRQSFRVFLSYGNKERISFEKTPQSELWSWFIIF